MILFFPFLCHFSLKKEVERFCDGDFSSELLARNAGRLSLGLDRLQEQNHKLRF